MAIFVSTTFFGDNSSVYEALDELRKTNITKIELGSNHREEPLELKRLGKRNTYVFHNYFPPASASFAVNIASRNPKVKSKSIDFIKNSINICSNAGIKYYTIHPGFLSEIISQHNDMGNRNFDFVFSKHKVSKKEVMQQTADIIKDLHEYAFFKGVNLLVENHGSITSKNDVIFCTLSDLKQLKEYVPDLKFNFNLAHAFLSGIDIKDKKTAEFIFENSVFFEASEIEEVYDSHLPILSAQGKVGEVLKYHKDIFKKCSLILEYRNIKIEEVKRSYDFVSKLLN